MSGHPRTINYAAELNAEQLDVVLHADGPCLVLAGAGSGKTRTITYRVAYLLEQGMDPSQILLLTFTNKSAKEMLARVNAILGQEARGIWGGTFHSIANKMLRSYAPVVGYTPSFSILDQDDSLSLIKAVMKEMRIDPKTSGFPTASVVSNILSYMRNTLSSVQSVLELKHPHFEQFRGDLEEIERRYRERKFASNAMDFDDLLIHWLKVMEHPEIGPRIARQFRAILVDEFQDTNALQARIVRALSSANKNVLVVGDDAQSIYAFRGADVQNILNFPDQWEGTRIFKLLTNYRSVPEILELANDSLSHNLEQFQKDLVPVKEKGKKPQLVAVASARQEAQFVAEKIHTLQKEGVALSSIAVLFRSSAHSQALEFELTKRDIAYEYRGGMRFFDRAHIKDALCYIRIFQNPQDEAAWLRVLNMQTGIGATTATSVALRVRALPDLRTISEVDARSLLPPRAQKGWMEFAEIAQTLVSKAPSPGDMLRSVVDSRYQEYLEREYPDWKDRLEDLEQLVIFADGYPDAAAFLADIALYDDAVGETEATYKTSDRVILTTIHQAKGLEWDAVFIIHLADSAFPNKRAMGEAGGMEEERRLFYVAVTRARKQLFLLYPLMSGFDGMTMNMPSLFIEEVSPRLIERVELDTPRSTGYRLGATGGYHSGNRLSAGNTDEDRSEWSWDGGFEEPSISLDRYGNRAPESKTVWKSSETEKKAPPKSFLRDIGDL